MNVVFFNDDGTLNVDRFEAFYQKNKDFSKYNNLERQALHAYLEIARKKQIDNPGFFEENPVMGSIVKLAIGSGIGAAIFTGGNHLVKTTIGDFFTGFLKSNLLRNYIGENNLKPIRDLLNNTIYKFFPEDTSLAKAGAITVFILFGTYLIIKGGFKAFKAWRKYCRQQKAELEMENYSMAKQIPSYNGNLQERRIQNAAIQQIRR